MVGLGLGVPGKATTTSGKTPPRLRSLRSDVAWPPGWEFLFAEVVSRQKFAVFLFFLGGGKKRQKGKGIVFGNFFQCQNKTDL